MSKPDTTPVRVLIVEDHEVVRLGLRTLLEKADGFHVVGEAGSVRQAVATALRVAPDVVLMDLRLPDGSGIEACRDIRAERPATRVLFLSSYADEDAAVGAVLAGASGYLLKDIGGEALIRGIISVAEGQSILNQSLIQQTLKRAHELEQRSDGEEATALSPQEERVLELVAEGKLNREIADIMGLRPTTVKNYLNTIFKKLHIHRRAQAAVEYVKRPRIEPDERP
jgi:DNA-binding NarL/FixJ family response regulator